MRNSRPILSFLMTPVLMLPVFMTAIIVVDAHAQTPPATPPAGAGAPVDGMTALKALNQDVQKGLQVLAGSYGSDPDVEAARIEAASVHLARVDQSMTTAPSTPAAARLVLDDNVNMLRREIERARLANACTRAARAITDEHRAGRAASDDQLRALSELTKRLQAIASPGWAKTVTYFVDSATRLDADRTALRSVSAKAASLEQAIREANAARRSVESHLEAGRGPVPLVTLLDAHRTSADKLSSLSPTIGAYHQITHQELLAHAAWQDESVDAVGTRLTSIYGAVFVDAGTAKSKTTKIKVPAEEAWCYAVFMRFDDGAGDADIQSTSWTIKGANSQFHVPRHGVAPLTIEGACVDKEQNSTLTVKSTASSKNPMRFTVIGWQKQNFPLLLAAFMTVDVRDPCDVDGFTAAFTDPVPGALVYRNQEPHVLLRAGRPTAPGATLLTASGVRLSNVPLSELTSVPPEKRAFTSSYTFPGCAVDANDRAGDSKKLQKCHESIDKKFEKLTDRAEAAVDRAKTDSAIEKANNALAKLADKEVAEREKKCAPMQRRLEEKFRRGYDKILDHHAQYAPTTPFDRAGELQKYETAKPDLR